MSIPPVVDAHAHIFTRQMPLAPGAWTRPDYDFTVEQYLALLDEHGIAFGVIAACSPFGSNNDYTLDALRRFERLRATVIVEPGISRATLAEMAGGGVVGVRLQLRNVAELPDLRAVPYRELLGSLADLGLHVELLARGADLPDLLPPLIEGGVKLVLDHFADPDPRLGPQSPGFLAALRAVENGRTWIKMSATTRIAPAVVKACAASLLANAGTGRLLWGSDAPFIGHEATAHYADTLRMFESMVPDPRQRHEISLTALRTFFYGE